MDDVFQMNVHLHFGATIHISCFRDKTNFYLYSNGISFKSIISLAANDGPTEASMALFKITPIVKFQSEEFLQKLLKERYESEEIIKTSEEQSKIFIDQFEFELSENNNLIQQQAKFPIRYNQDFMLQHIYSCKYLTYIKNEKTNQFVLQLSEIPTKHSVFNLQACFNYQKDINTYIPFNSAAFLNIKIYDGLQIKDYFLNFKNESVFDSWTTSEEEKQQISIGLYQTGEEVEYKDIFYGDTIWIFHLESGSFVKLKEKEENQVQSFILKKINYALGFVKESDELKLNQRNSVADRSNEAITCQIFLQKTENETSAQKFGLWKIIYASEKETNNINRKDHFDRFKGGKVKFDQEIRFYSIRHKVYLSVRKIKAGRNKFKYQLATQKSQEPNTTFRLKSLSPNSIYATIEDLFLIQHVISQTYLTLQQPFKVNEQTAFLTPSTEYKKEDNFKFTKIEFIQEWENNYILSILPFLREGIKVLENNREYVNSREDILLQLLVENLIQLLTFSYDLTEGFQASSNKLGKMTYNHYMVQKLLKEQGVIQELIKLLENINISILQKKGLGFNQTKDIFKIVGSLKIVKNFTPELLTQKKTIPLDASMLRKIVNLALKILRNCCKSNNDNSLILFKEINTLIKFLSMNTYAQKFFIDAFSNNLILDKMTSQQFREINSQYEKIYRITNVYNPELFELLTHFIKLQDSSINKNQLEVFKLFFQEKNPLIFPIESYSNCLYIYFDRKKYQLSQFSKLYPMQSNTLAAQIKFFSYLTFDRNYVCSKRMKELFPLDIIISYIMSTHITNEVKQSLINIFTFTYLDERPRFHRKTQKVFNFYEIYNKEQLKQSLNSTSKENQKRRANQMYQYELKEMQNTGFSRQNISEIMNCIEEKNYVDEESLNEMKQWLVKELKDSMAKNDDQFYSCTIDACLTCFKTMIQLNIFNTEDDNYLEEMITNIVKRIGQSLQLQNQNKIVLKSNNFKELLLQMVQKNVIKRFNFSNQFDGLEDQVTCENICSLYVNYSFYQNILLLEKNPGKRKQSVKVIVSVLELGKIYNNMFIESKLAAFLGEILQQEDKYRKSQSKKKLIDETIIKKIFHQPMKGREDIIKLLLLLFYNNNSYSINFASISLIANEIFSQVSFLEHLEQLIFIVDKQEKEKFDKIVRIYKEIRLLTETSEVWLNSDYEKPNYQFSSIILYYMDKIKKILKIVVQNFRDEHSNVYDCLSGLEKNIDLEKQIILSNVYFEEEILTFIQNYKHFLKKITRVTRGNQLIVKLFQYCFLFLYVFIYNCDQNKNKLKHHIEDIHVTTYFMSLTSLELGQSRFLAEYLKDNYDECIDFFQKNSDLLYKANKFTQIHSKLFIILLKYYDEPIMPNLKKFFISIFDFNSFKTFLWLKDGKQFQLNPNLLAETDFEPIFYQINAIEAILYLFNNLSESRNTIKNHIKKSLSEEYLIALLNKDDYFTKENSIKPLLKIQIIFKAKILELYCAIYLQESSPYVAKQLTKYKNILDLLIEEAPSRQETEDFRKIIILKDIKNDEMTISDYKINELFEINYRGIFLLNSYLKSIQNFARCCMRTDTLIQIHPLAETILEQILYLYDILHHNHKKKINIIYPIPHQLNFKLEIKKDKFANQRKKYFLSLILQTIYNGSVYKQIKENQLKSSKVLRKTLDQINLKPFLFLRKISEFLEDAFQKLPQDEGGKIFTTLSRLAKILKRWIQSEKAEKASQIRNMMGKSELVFPILNYFETSSFDPMNRSLFLENLEFLTQLLGDEGNKMIQGIFNSYFTNKADSIDFFMKMKQILREINFQERASYKCRKLYDGIETYNSDVSLKKTAEFTLLNFLINLCKGNYRDNQIFLGGLSKTSNFNVTRSVWEILRFQSLKYPIHLINVQNYYRITQCLSTIRELVEGPCIENQNQFLKRDFFMTVLAYLEFSIKDNSLELDESLEKELEEISKISSGMSSELRQYLNQDKITKVWMPSQVKYRCISLISSLMSQNVNEKSLSQLFTISPKLLVKELDLVYERYSELALEYKRQNLQFQDEKQVVLPLGFKIYEVLQYYPKDKIPESSPGLDFFKDNSRIVEVLHENLTIVVFPRISTEISQGFKTTFLQNVDRTSINSKLRDLQKAEIQNRQSDWPYGNLVFFLVLGLIMLDLLLYNESALVFVQDFTMYSIFQAYGINSQIELAKAIFLILIIIFSIVFLVLEIRGAVYMQETISGILKSDVKSFDRFKALMTLLKENLDYFHYFFVILMAVMGIFNPLFDSVLLVVELFRRSETFFLILRAIKDTLDQLCVVLLIDLILTYILASIIYYYYASYQFPVECQTLYNCFIFNLSAGFKTDPTAVGFIDGTLIANNFSSVTLSDVIVNFSYLFIIKVIMDQVIGAIIVDKFAQIREEKQNLEKDQNTFCFICGLERNVLDRQEDGFEKHKEQYHNIWNYMQFLIHIKQSKLGNLTGIERFVYDQYKSGKLNWFPISRSLHLENKNLANQEPEEDQEDQVEKLTKNLDQEINEINVNIKQVQDYVNIRSLKDKKNA